MLSRNPPRDAPNIDACDRPDAGLDANRSKMIPSGTYIPPPPTPHDVATPATRNQMNAPRLMYDVSDIV